MSSINWSIFDLTKQPFLINPVINVQASDERINGKLFCEEIVEDEMRKLLGLIDREQPAVYVSSTSNVLGSGKSALMAAAYWKFEGDDSLCVWVEATGGLSTSPTLGRVLDAMVSQGLIEELKSKIGSVDFQTIKDRLSEFYTPPSAALIQALVKILETDPGDTAKKFANIRRSILIASANELFGYLVRLFVSTGKKRTILFVDQFEEFILAHSGPSELRRLGDDMNDLLRAIQGVATLVVSLHPGAERILDSAAGDYVQTLAPMTPETLIVLKPITFQEALKLARYYLTRYRVSGSKVTEIHPFHEDVVRYFTIKTGGTPRRLITAFHNALVEAGYQNHPVIDGAFVSDDANHSKILLGAENEWSKFKKGELERA